MMRIFTYFLQRHCRAFFRILRGKRGYTLAEMTAVVGITATLTALSVPVVISQIEKGKLSRVAKDIDNLGTAVAKFGAYTNEIPAFDGSGKRDTIQLLVVGQGEDPQDNTGTWGKITRRDDGYNHLVNDSPEGVKGAYTSIGIRWDGPYMPDTKEDPWGHNYYIFVEPLYTPELSTSPDRIFGWILSAGPNGILETSTTSMSPNDNPVNPAAGGDDLGRMIGKANVYQPIQ